LPDKKTQQTFCRNLNDYLPLANKQFMETAMIFNFHIFRDLCKRFKILHYLKCWLKCS